LVNGLHKNGPMWIYSINKEIILNIFNAINYECDIQPNILQEINNKRTMIMYIQTLFTLGRPKCACQNHKL
jgi:hypothetical protein